MILNEYQEKVSEAVDEVMQGADEILLDIRSLLVEVGEEGYKQGRLEVIDGRNTPFTPEQWKIILFALTDWKPDEEANVIISIVKDIVEGS